MNSKGKSFPRKKVIQNTIILIFLGVAVHLLLPQIATLEKSINILLKMTYWYVGLAFVMQIISYLGSGFLLQKTLLLVKNRTSLLRSTLIVMGAASVSMVAGGTVGSTAAIFRWTNTGKENIGGSTLASLLPSLFNTLMLVIASIFGIAHLILTHDLSNTQLIGFSLTLVFLGIIIGASFLASHYRNRTFLTVVWLSKTLATIRKRPFDTEFVRKEFDIIFLAWDELWKGKWRKVLIGALLNTTFDMLTLYFIFFAVGNHISFGVLLSGYALPLLLGKMAFFLPGGVGVVESSMAALYTSLGIPNATAVVVILGYRLISFWIPSILGFPIAAYLQRTINQQKISAPR